MEEETFFVFLYTLKASFDKNCYAFTWKSYFVVSSILFGQSWAESITMYPQSPFARQELTKKNQMILTKGKQIMIGRAPWLFFNNTGIQLENAGPIFSWCNPFPS